MPGLLAGGAGFGVNGFPRKLARNWILPFIDPRRLAALVRLPRFFVELSAYRSRAVGERVTLSDAFPCLADRSATTPFDPHYFYQGAWLARELAGARPALHVDVGSSATMLSTLSATVPMVFIDYRPLHATLPGLQCVAGDVCRLPFRDGSIVSLSCLHVIEHIGLGRYGDPLDPQGSAKAARELARVLAPGARLYVSAPVGRPHVCFNAHRVFSPQALPSLFPGLRVVRFCVVDDAGVFHVDADPAAAAENEYGCGMYVMTQAQR
jgi:SAM-dependent methyltransferase